MGSKASKESKPPPKRIVFETELSETQKIMEINNLAVLHNCWQHENVLNSFHMYHYFAQLCSIHWK